MGLFGNQPSQNAPPVDAVAQLRSQQRSDHEIIDELSRQGYSSIDIYNALNQADQGAPSQNQAPQAPQNQGYPDQTANAPVQDAGPQEYAPAQQEQNAPAQNQYAPASSPETQDPWSNQGDDPWSNTNIVHAQPSQQAQPSAPQPPAPQPPSQPAPSPPPAQPPSFNAPAPPSEPKFSASTFGGSDATIDQIDQVAEAIIDEKWKEMKAYIEKIVDWKGKVENRIIAVEENQKMLNEQIVGLQKSMLDKVQTYDRHITDVGTEIKAMEKVFQKIIPSLTENVNELSSVVHRMKDDQ